MDLRKYSLERQVNKIRKIREQKRKTIDVEGKQIIVNPNVFDPSTDTRLLIRTVRPSLSDTVLEACAGTGAISIHLATRAKHVTATDINPYAVLNITENINFHRLGEKIRVELADIFPSGNERYDLIVINPPYTDHPASDIVEQSVWDPGNRVVHRLFKEGKRYLNFNGRVYLAWGNFADFDFIEALAEDHGFDAKVVGKDKNGVLVFRVYELSQAITQ